MVAWPSAQATAGWRSVRPAADGGQQPLEGGRPEKGADGGRRQEQGDGRRATRVDVRGGPEDETVAANPTAAFDEFWGKGFIKPEQFTRFAYQSLK